MNKSAMTIAKKKLLSRRIIDRKTGCWLWPGATNGNWSGQGHGQVFVGTEKFYVHRLSMTVFGKKNPGPKHVLHKCDTPPCFNPKHLYLGTEKDNSRDRMDRGQQARGSRVGTSKLTAKEIRAIRREGAIYGNQPLVAKKYGIHRMSVSRIVRRVTWAHLL